MTFTIYVIFSCVGDLTAFIHSLLCSKNCPMCRPEHYNNDSLLKLGSTKNDLATRYCAMLRDIVEMNALDFSRETKFYGDDGDRQLPFDVEAYVLVRILEELDVQPTEFHTEQFVTNEFVAV